MSTNFKRIPYGIADFKQVRNENLYFVDKTIFFEKMERAGHFLFLVRPRRFGKSLFLDMLETYYDINEKDNFQKLFKGLYVAEHPTPEQGEFQVLHLDFSMVGSDLENLYENFNVYLKRCCEFFAKKYASFYPEGFVEDMKNEQTGMGMLNRLHAASHELGHKLYLIVDEYDNFTNNVLNVKGQQAYHELTHGTGFYRDIFKLFKPMFDRIEHEPRRTLQPDARLLGERRAGDDPLLQSGGSHRGGQDRGRHHQRHKTVVR